MNNLKRLIKQWIEAIKLVTVPKIKLKLKQIVLAVVNLVTDVIVPFMSIITLVVEILPIPAPTKYTIKMIEEWLKVAGRTAYDIRKEINKMK